MRLPPLRIALLADGTSDRALLPVLRWVLMQADPELELATPEFRAPHRGDFTTEIPRTIELYDPHVLFVHRDAEGVDPDVRRREIPEAGITTVRVVPVRMTEAWLLGDEDAIRGAAGKPGGSGQLDLPPIRRIEGIPDPKQVLHEALRSAAEVAGRRARQFQKCLQVNVQRVAELTADFAPLRALPAFQRLESDCRQVVGAFRRSRGCTPS